MNRSKTSYHFKIIASDVVMEVFGTVMSRTPEGIVLDIWCPEEPRLNHRITLAVTNVPQMLEDWLRDNLETILSSGSCFALRYLLY